MQDEKDGLDIPAITAENQAMKEIRASKNLRYSRQVRNDVIGENGQEKISNSSVLLIGCGALGSVVADLLTRAGVGKLKIIDRDIPEIHNLQRQTIFNEQDIEQATPKAVAAVAKLQKVNSLVELAAVVEDFNYLNAQTLISDVDLIIDGTDNFETRQLINDVAIKHYIPWIYGGAIGTDGMVKAVIPGQTSCFRCIMDELPEPGSFPTCETAGIIAPTSVIVASLQVVNALKWLTGEEIEGDISVLDSWHTEMRSIPVPKKENCPACARRQFDFLKGDKGSRVSELCGQDTVQILPSSRVELDLEQIAARLVGLGEIKQTEHYLKFQQGEIELMIFPDGRALVRGTEDKATARALVAKYIGN